MVRRISKAEKRRLRKKERDDKKRERLCNAVAPYLDSQKRIKSPYIASPKKSIRSNPHIKTRQDLKKIDLSNSKTFHQYSLSWCCNLSDLSDSWSWGEPRQWNDSEWENDICTNFNGLDGRSWSEVCNDLKVTVGKKNNKKTVPRHHLQEVDTLISEAQQRWIKIGLEQFETAFRFRFSGTKRVWGVIVEGLFYLIWWERKHKIYPVDKSHT